MARNKALLFAGGVVAAWFLTRALDRLIVPAEANGPGSKRRREPDPDEQRTARPNTRRRR